MKRVSRKQQQPLPQPLGGLLLPGDSLIVFVLRFRLGEGVVMKVILCGDGLVPGAFVPLWRSPGGGDPRRGCRLADVLQDGPNIDRFRDEGDDPHLGPAL
jgi:hypothetical protein